MCMFVFRASHARVHFCVLYCIALYCIVLYLYIFVALLAVHANHKRFQCERPTENRVYVFVAGCGASGDMAIQLAIGTKSIQKLIIRIHRNTKYSASRRLLVHFHLEHVRGSCCCCGDLSSLSLSLAATSTPRKQNGTESLILSLTQEDYQ